jgi:hypothetical protein
MIFITLVKIVLYNAWLVDKRDVLTLYTNNGPYHGYFVCVLI